MSPKIKHERPDLENKNTPSITIEKFKPKDKDKIIEFILEVQQEFGLEIPLKAQPDLENLETAYESLWLAKSGDKIVGTIACIKLLNGDLVWKKWYVHKDFRKYGIGGKLIKELKDYAKKHGVINIWIGSIEKKFISAVKYYGKIGGIEIGKDEISEAVVDYPHNPVDNIFFRLPINLDPYHRYQTAPTFEQLTTILRQKVEIDPNLLTIQKQLRDKMLSLALGLSMLVQSVGLNLLNPYHRYLISESLDRVNNLDQLYLLAFKDNQVSNSEILIDFNKDNTLSSNNKHNKSVYLNMYISGYAIESLKITKDQLQYNPLIFNRIWIEETQNIISRLKKIHQILETYSTNSGNNKTLK